VKAELGQGACNIVDDI